MSKAILALVMGGALACAFKPAYSPGVSDMPKLPGSSATVSVASSPDRSTTTYRIEKRGLIDPGGTFSIAPDGKHYASYEMSRGISFGAAGSMDAPGKFGAPRMLDMFQYSHVDEYAWSADSRAIFSSQRAITNPGGWATGAISPVLVTLDGKVRQLPRLTHPAGDLDGIAWIGHQGVALAEFGTKGDYYHPEHPNPNPTIAIVDALRGRILQSAALPPGGPAKDPRRILAMDARFDKDGRIYALFRMTRSRWFEWRQGSSLHAIPTVDTANETVFAITPDLKHVLITYHLMAHGAICENQSKPCPPLIPVEGKIAELHDLATGKPIWTINGISRSFSLPLKPAISDDGSIAVMTMPDAALGRDHIVLISMRDGLMIRSLETPPTTARGIGFREGGKVAWIRSYGMVQMFHLQR